jgi:hypothetical protein
MRRHALDPAPKKNESWLSALLAWQAAGAAGGLLFGAALLARNPIPGAEIRFAAIFLGAGSLFFMGSAVVFGATLRAFGIRRAALRDFALHARLAAIGVGALLAHMLAREADLARGYQWLCAFLGMLCGAAIGSWAAGSRFARPIAAVVTSAGAIAIVGMAVVSQFSRGPAANSRPVAFAPIAPRPVVDPTNTRVRLLVIDWSDSEPSCVYPPFDVPNSERVRSSGATGQGADDRPIGDDTPWVSLLTGMPPSRHGARAGSVLRANLAPAMLRVRSRPIRDWLEILRVARADPAELAKLGCKSIATIAAEAGRKVVMTQWLSESDPASGPTADLWVFLAQSGGRLAIEHWLESQRATLEPNDVLVFAYVAPARPELEPDFHGTTSLVLLGLLGSGIRHADLAFPTIYDLAPTILHILGIPAGRDMPGRVLTEALTDSRPARRISTWESPPVAR